MNRLLLVTYVRNANICNNIQSYTYSQIADYKVRITTSTANIFEKIIIVTKLETFNTDGNFGWSF